MLIWFSTLTSHWHLCLFVHDCLLYLPSAEAKDMVGTWLGSEWPKVNLTW